LQIGVSNLIGTAVKSVEETDIKETEEDINKLMLFHAILSIIIFLLTCAYFPRYARCVLTKTEMISSFPPGSSDKPLQLNKRGLMEELRHAMESKLS
jgi:hypothetical protein